MGSGVFRGGYVQLKLLRHFHRKPSSTNFIPEIDGLRFLAVITVVLFHLNTALSKELGIEISQALVEMGGAKINFTLAWWWVRLDLGVKVFFAISGFVLALPFLRFYLGLSKKKIDLKSYFIRRLTRLEPPFIVTLICLYLIHVFLLKEDSWDFLKHLGAGLIYGHVFIFGYGNPINPVTWSLETEAQFYVIIPAVMWMVFKGRSAFTSSLCLLALIASSILFRNEFAFSAHWGRSILAYFSNFAIGIVVCWIYLRYHEWFNTRFWMYDVVGLIATLGLFYFYKPQHEMVNQLFFNFCIALVMITAFKGVVFNWFYTRPLVYMIGGMCYSIYLIHYAFLHLSMKFTKLLVFNSWSYTQNLALQVIVNLVLILLVSSMFFVLIEKPTMDKNWTRKLIKKR